MTRLAHETERLRCMTDIPRGERQRPKRISPEELKQLTEHLLYAFRAGFDQVKRPIGHARMVLGEHLGVSDVGLAHLDETAVTCQQVKRGVHKLAGEGVQDDIHTSPVSLLQEALLELKRARGGDM